MTLRSLLSSLFALSLAAFFGAGCSFTDAKVGAPQEACGIGDGDNVQPAPGGGSYYQVGAKMTTSPTCEGNTGSSCDDCESAHCCVSRSACYGDPVCACADLALDECLDKAESAPAAEIAARTAECWNSFSAAGTVEKARIACQRSWCQTECEVP